jgi:hypothetical protein
MLSGLSDAVHLKADANEARYARRELTQLLSQQSAIRRTSGHANLSYAIRNCLPHSYAMTLVICFSPQQIEPLKDAAVAPPSWGLQAVDRTPTRSSALRFVS